MKTIWNMLMRFCRCCLGLAYRLVRAELTDERWNVWEQFIKFLFVGLSNTVVVLVVYYAVLLLAGVEYYLLGQTLGYALGVLNSYLWNSRFVFAASRRKHGRAFVKMCLCYGMTYVLQMGMLYLGVDVLHIGEIVSPVIAVLVTTPVNFVLNKVFAFGER